jgi:hypothetical protein
MFPWQPVPASKTNNAAPLVTVREFHSDIAARFGAAVAISGLPDNAE